MRVVGRILGLLISMLAMEGSAWAQSAGITGTITDETGRALPGVLVGLRA